MTAIVINVEGVLAAPGGSSLMNCESTGYGRELYASLRHTSRIILLTSETNDEVARAWLLREHFRQYAALHCYTGDHLGGPDAWKLDRLSEMLGLGHHIGFFFDSSPRNVAEAVRRGVTGVLIAPPAVLAGTGGAERVYTSWQDLVTVIEEQNLLKAAVSTEEEED